MRLPAAVADLRMWLERHIKPILFDHKNAPTIAAIVVSMAVMVWHASQYLTYCCDDPFISLRYADRFRQGLGLTWNNFERVEGATNFLWYFIIGLIGFVVDDLVLVGLVLGYVGTGVTIGALAWAVRERGWIGSVPSWFAGLAIASLGPVASWTVGGLEVPMVMGALAVAIGLSYELFDSDRLRWRVALGLGATLAVLSMTRPDGTLFTATFCAGLVLGKGFRKSAWLEALIAGGVSSAAFAGLSVFRKLYYGHWFPNTASKLQLGSLNYETGLNYVTKDYTFWLPLLVLASMAVLLGITSLKVRQRVAILVPSLVVWLAYVVIIRGDHMPERRHLLQAFVLLIALGAETLREAVRSRSSGRQIVWFGAIASVAWLAAAQIRDKERGDANRAVWVWHGKPIGLMFRDGFAEQKPLMAVDAAGSVPFFTGFETIDMLGINDAYIASHPPEDIGKGLVGHELGDGAYVLSRNPDLILFHLTYGSERPVWRSGRQMVATAQWRNNYQRMYYRTPSESLEGVAHVRHTEGPLAPKWHDGAVDFPVYLLATSNTNRATLGERNKWVLSVASGGESSYKLPVEGSYRRCGLDFDATDGVTLSASFGDATTEISGTGKDYVTKRPDQRVLMLQVKGGEYNGTVRGLRLRCEP